jgi:hypothetical protein
MWTDAGDHARMARFFLVSASGQPPDVKPYSDTMQLELIGPHPFARNERGDQISRIGTLFPAKSALYTRPPAVHAMQRGGFIDHLNARGASQGLNPFSPEEEETIVAQSVDLFFEPDHIQIRPDPERMDLAFCADELLQQMVSKRQVRFLSVSDPRVREAIKRQGEYWRLSTVPKTDEGREKIVSASKVAIHGSPIYYYNRLTGTRWLTWQAFDGLGNLDHAALARHLQEIAEHSARRNRLGRPEIDFFAAELCRFGPRDFGNIPFETLPSEELRAKYEELKARFRLAVHEAFTHDDCRNRPWAERILSTLVLDGNETETEQVLSGLSPEFFLRIDWLAGGRFEEGEFLLDPIFEEAASHPNDTDLQRLCDPRAKEIIFNIIRDYGDLEYINVGCIRESLSLDRPQKDVRRGVYLAEFLPKGEAASLKRFMRLQKWGVWEHLDELKDLLHSIQESEQNTPTIASTGGWVAGSWE